MNLAVGTVAPVLVIIEVLMYFDETLTPRRMMTTQFITSGVAFAALILDAIAYTQRLGSANYNILGLVIGSIFM